MPYSSSYLNDNKTWIHGSIKLDLSVWKLVLAGFLFDREWGKAWCFAKATIYKGAVLGRSI